MIRALLCVPLVLRGQPLGVIYLTAAAARPFNEDHLHLLTVMSGIAAYCAEHEVAARDDGRGERRVADRRG